MQITATVSTVAMGQNNQGQPSLVIGLTLETGASMQIYAATSDIQSWLPGASKTITIA